MASRRSTIEVFFRATGMPTTRASIRSLKKDVDSLKSSFASAGRFTAAGLTAGLTGASKATLGLVRNVGGLRPAFGAALTSVRALNAGLAQTRNWLVISGVAALGLTRGLASLSTSNSDLESTVLALRAMNDEIDKTGNKRPVFESASGYGSGFNTDNPGQYFLSVPRKKNQGGIRDANTGFTETAQDLQFLNKVADEHGTRIIDMSKDYLKLRAATKGTATTGKEIEAVFDGIADAGLVLGRSGDEMSRAFTALQQISSKGTVTAEELRGQLSEAIPGATAIAARAFNQTTSQFLDNVQKGSVGASEFIAKFGRQLQKEYSESAKSMTKTTRVAFGRLANAWFNARVLIANGALDERIASITNSLAKLLNTLGETGAFKRFGKNLADSLGRIDDRFKKAVDGGYDFERVLDAIAKGFDWLIRAGEGMFDLTVDIYNGFKNVIGIMRSYGIYIPRVEAVTSGLGQAVKDFFQTLNTGQFSGRPFIDFLASATSLSIELFKLFASSIGPGPFNSIGDGLQYAAYWMGQLGFAVRAFNTGDGTKLDSLGIGMVANLSQAKAKFDELKEGAIGFFDVLTGGQGERGDAKANGIAAGINALVTGKDEDFALARGGNVDYDGELSMLFELRGILEDVATFIVENKEAIAAFFVGAIDFIEGVTEAVNTLGDVLKALGVDASVGYILGMLFVFSKIPGGKLLLGSIAAKTTTEIKGLGTAFTKAKGKGKGFLGNMKGITRGMGAMAGKMGALAARLGVIGIAAAGTYAIYDEFSNEIGGGADLLVGGIQGGLSNITGALGFDNISNDLRDAANDNYAAFEEASRRNDLYDDFDGSPVQEKLLEMGLSDDEAFNAYAEGRAGDLIAQNTADMVASQRDMVNEQKRMADEASFSSEANDNGSGSGEFREKIVINVNTGERFEVMGRNSDLPGFRKLASQNHAGRPPAYAGANG